MAIKTISTQLNKKLTRITIEDFDKKVVTYKEFVHISQFENVNKETKKIPDGVTFMLNSSPKIGYGEFLFGVNPDDHSLEWLGSIIDSGD